MKPQLAPISAGLMLAFLSALAPHVLRADTVTLKDGSVIHGTIQGISGGTVTVATNFAGTLAIKQDQVVGLTTKEPVFVKTKSNSTILGRVAPEPSGLVVASAGGPYTTTVANIKAFWLRTGEDPELAALRRHWVAEVSTNIAGTSGNTTGFAGGLSASATLKSPTDSLKFYASANHTVANGQTSEDMYRGGVEYNAFFSPVWSWYVSTELMQDNVRDIALRVSTLGGLGWSAIRRPSQDLQFRAGLSYRYETYNSVPPTPNFASAGVNFGIVHRLDLKPWGVIHNTLSYVPSFRNFSNYVINQDSNLTMPFGGSKVWSTRIGISNEYNSIPVAHTKRLDTLYYLRFVYDVH